MYSSHSYKPSILVQAVIKRQCSFFDVCLSHLNINMLMDLGEGGGGGYGVLLRMAKTLHKINVEDLVNFGIKNIEFQNTKHIVMTECLVLSNTNGLKR